MKRPHVDYKYFYIKELIKERGGKHMNLRFMPSSEQWAHSLTKGVPKPKHAYFCKEIGLAQKI